MSGRRSWYNGRCWGYQPEYDRRSTDVAGGGLCRPTVDDDQEDQESLEDGEENGDESPSGTTGVEAPEVPPDPVDRGSLPSGFGVDSL